MNDLFPQTLIPKPSGLSDKSDKSNKSEITFSGTIERIIYKNETNGYIVIAVTPEGKTETETCAGNSIPVEIGSIVEITGTKSKTKYGDQIKIISLIPSIPKTGAGMTKYLGSGLIHGIGKIYAKKIVGYFGDETISVLDNSPDRLKEVPGIGEKRIEQIKASWQQQRAISEIMIALSGYGISPAYAAKIYKQYKGNAIAVIKDNPYKLAQDIQGIGFKIADNIARNCGFDIFSVSRAEAGILYILNEAAGDGNTYLPVNVLLTKATDLLYSDIPCKSTSIIESLHSSVIQKALENLATDEKGEETCAKIRTETISKIPCMFLSRLHFAESYIAENLTLIIDKPLAKQIPIQAVTNSTLTPEQLGAIAKSLNNKVSVITGGPGTGKTTITKTLIEILETQKKTFLLASPTGRAAKRLSEATGKPACTIHRLLEYDQFSGFTRDEATPLEADVILIDEASMIDIPLANHLIRAVNPESQIIFVGDIDQLPSVGPGNFLKDLISSAYSRQIAVSRLTQIFRQAQNSLIVTNAHKINHGEMPTYRPSDTSQVPDFYFIDREEPEEALKVIVDLAKTRIKQDYGFDPINDIQIFSPMYKGIIGVQNLNAELQKTLNPFGKVFTKGFLTLRSGDKVIQTKNNYDKEVFNGDIGVVKDFNEAEQEVYIEFDGNRKTYSYDDLDDIQLAYAITIHKSQGSEYPVVIMPVSTQHFIMLQRNLIYTGLTRGKKLVFLIGTKKALAMAIKNNSAKTRYSALSYFMQPNATPLSSLSEEIDDFIPM